MGQKEGQTSLNRHRKLLKKTIKKVLTAAHSYTTSGVGYEKQIKNKTQKTNKCISIC